MSKRLTDAELIEEAARRGMTVSVSKVRHESGTTYATTDEVPR